MSLHALRLVRIVAEPALAPVLIELITAQGARGYTQYDAIGFGEHGRRAGASPDDRNIVIEVLTSEHDAERMLQRVQEAVSPRHALIAYMIDARAIRREKFV